jgi:hypothetical protein
MHCEPASLKFTVIFLIGDFARTTGINGTTPSIRLHEPSWKTKRKLRTADDGNAIASPHTAFDGVVKLLMFELTGLAAQVSAGQMGPERNRP